MSDSVALAGFAFTQMPLDRADALRDDALALSALWPQAQILVLDEDGQALADAQDQPLLLQGGTLGEIPEGAIFLGLRAQTGWFCLDTRQVAVTAPRRVGLRQAAVTWPQALATVFASARAMRYWQTRTRFCGVCGGLVTFARGGFLGRCGQCGAEHHPRVDPAVIVAVSDGQRLLLGRQPRWAPRRYSVIAGFVEPGESLEQTVTREVFEETGVRVHDVRYLGTQPWPFPGALMLGFQARAQAGQAPQVNGELEEARWCSHAEIDAALYGQAGEDGMILPSPISIGYALIRHWHHTHGPLR